jgi:ABC-type multidrug transport system ATPase subunit
MIEVRDLVQHYGIKPVIRGIDFTVEAGELVSVMGANGVGKSTVLACCAGVLSPQRGYVAIDGVRRRSNPDEELELRRKTAYLPTDYWIPRHMTVREYIMNVGRLYRVEDQRLMDHCDRLLKLFHLRDQADASMTSCSTGQQKKTAVAALLATDAPLLIMDEPFSGGLDPSALAALRRVMQHLAEREDRTILMATPVPELVEDLAHRILILSDGRIAAYGSPAELRLQTGCDGSLQEVIECITSPDAEDQVNAYLAGEDR